MDKVKRTPVKLMLTDIELAAIKDAQCKEGILNRTQWIRAKIAEACRKILTKHKEQDGK